MGPRELPAIKLEAKVHGKKVSRNFKATMNTSFFANQIVDLLETSDNKEIAIQVKTKKAKMGLGERLLRKVGLGEEETLVEEAPSEEASSEDTKKKDDEKLKLG